MGMLTLNDVVGAHQQGVEWRQQRLGDHNKRLARLEKRLSLSDAMEA